MRYFAFLRAINVGGHTVTMADLRRHFTRLGLKEVETFIASGNVVFESPARETATLERKIERHLADALGYEVRTFLRDEQELAAVARLRPFPAARHQSATAFVVGFLAAPLGPSGRKVVAALTTPDDDFHLRGRELYWLCQTRQSDSTFSNAVFERLIKGQATFRSITTIVKLATKYGLAPPAGTVTSP